jgi:hypothetical protein
LVIAGPSGLKEERMVSRAKLGCTRLILTHMSDNTIRRARDLPSSAPKMLLIPW